MTPEPEQAAAQAEMLRLRDGVPGAFDQVLARYRQPVFAFCQRMLGDLQEAEDAAQEVFLRLLQSSGSYQPQGRPIAWVLRIARNYCLNRQDRLRHRRHAALDEARSSAGPAPALDTDDRETVRRAILSLPPDQRTAVLLRRYHGLTYDEIAIALNRSAGSIDGLLSRARANLRERLSPLTPTRRSG